MASGVLSCWIFVLALEMTGDGAFLWGVTFCGVGLVALALLGSNHLLRSRCCTGDFIGAVVGAGICGLLGGAGCASTQSFIGGGAIGDE